MVLRRRLVHDWLTTSQTLLASPSQASRIQMLGFLSSSNHLLMSLLNCCRTLSLWYLLQIVAKPPVYGICHNCCKDPEFMAHTINSEQTSYLKVFNVLFNVFFFSLFFFWIFFLGFWCWGWDLWLPLWLANSFLYWLPKSTPAHDWAFVLKSAPCVTCRLLQDPEFLTFVTQLYTEQILLFTYLIFFSQCCLFVSNLWGIWCSHYTWEIS